MRLQGKTAIVTGAGSGIGAAIVQRFLDEGAKVVATDLSFAASLDHPNVIEIQHDVTREEDWDRVIRTALDRFGGVDIHVNNAGVSATEPFAIARLSLSEWRRVLAVNLDGAFLGTRAAMSAMAENGGSIVNIASIHSIVAACGTAAYSASKGGLSMLTKVAAVEGASLPSKIRVNALLPGYIETPLVAARFAQAPDRLAKVVSSTPMGCLGDTNDVASATVFLASDESKFTTGASLVVDGGYTAI